MTRPVSDWAYLIDDSGRHWYHLSDGQKKQPDETGFRPPSGSLFAIPTNDIVSIPQWISSKDGEIINEVVSLEAERFGVGRDSGPGKTIDWQTVALNGTRTLVQSLSIPWELSELNSIDTQFSGFVPQFALYEPPEHSVVLWTEDDVWVAGYSRGRRWVHVQTLGSGTPESITSEIQLTLLELSAKGVVDSLEQIVVWGDLNVPLYRALEEGTGREVIFEKRPSPSGADVEWSFEPHLISEHRLVEAKRKKGFLFAILALVFLILIVGAAIGSLWMLEQSNRRLQNLVTENRPSADEIQNSIDRWYALTPAVDPKRSPLNLFHQVSVLLPEKGFRLTSFEIQNSNTIIIRGEGATMPSALKMRGAIENAEGLADYTWEIPPPTIKGGLIELVATGTYQFAGNEEE